MKSAPGTELNHVGAEFFEAPDVALSMLINTWAFLGSLSPEWSARCQFELGDDRREDWDFIPKPDRAGVPFKAMDPHQRTLAHTLLKSGLSMRGYTQALQIMAMENVLRELEIHDGLTTGVVAGDFRHQDNYFFSFFGRPGFEDTWGWRILGHHLSISYTIVRQRYIAVTPCNMGAEPAPVGVMNPLGSDEDLAFTLLESMAPDLRSTAVIHDVAPADYVTRQVPRIGKVEYPDNIDLGLPFYEISDHDRDMLKFERDVPRGVAAQDLGSAQQETLRTLICWYMDRFPAEIADHHRRRLDADSTGNIFFCWAGQQRKGAPHYYRIQTSDYLIEFDNAISNGNHIHSIWRDFTNDLGHDLLLDHYEKESRTGHHLDRRLQSSVARDE